jgi:hypothetical protein
MIFSGHTPHPPRFFDSNASVKSEDMNINNTRPQKMIKMRSSPTSEKLPLMNKPESILTHEAQCRPDALSSSSAKKYLGARSTHVLAPLRLARKFACNHPPHQIKE